MREEDPKEVLLIGGNESPVLPILKNLYEHSIQVTVASHKKLSIEFASRYPKERLMCPDPKAEEDAFIDWLETTVKSGRYAVTLACGEDQTWLLSKAKDRIKEHTIVTVPDSALFLICRNKSRTMKEAERLGIPIPKTYYPEDYGIDSVISAIPAYPVVLKPCISSSARGISYPASADELREVYVTTREEYGPCIVQEYISHDGMQYKAEIILDKDKNVLAKGVYNKPRYYPPEGGASTLNCTVDRPDITDAAVRFLSGIGWTGMGDCDFIVDPKNDVPKLMEVNPRCTRSIKVLVCAGLEYPYILYCLALGIPVDPQYEYKKGVYLRYFWNDCAWFLRSPDRFRTRPSFFWLWGRNLHEEIFSWSDPWPWFVFTWSLFSRLFSRKERKFLLRMS